MIRDLDSIIISISPHPTYILLSEANRIYVSFNNFENVFCFTLNDIYRQTLEKNLEQDLQANCRPFVNNKKGFKIYL